MSLSRTSTSKNEGASNCGEAMAQREGATAYTDTVVVMDTRTINA
jgi:hypothetical protein